MSPLAKTRFVLWMITFIDIISCYNIYLPTLINNEYDCDVAAPNGLITKTDYCIIDCNHTNINQQSYTTQCRGSGHCMFRCTKSGCFDSGFINASDAVALTVTSNTRECMRGATVYAPNTGHARFYADDESLAGASLEGTFKEMTINDGAQTVSITVTCSVEIESKECKSLTINAQHTQYLEVNAVRSASMDYAKINCPQNSAYSGPELAPCVLNMNGSRVSATNLEIVTLRGTPQDAVFRGGRTSTYTGSILRCTAGISHMEGSVFKGACGSIPSETTTTVSPTTRMPILTTTHEPITSTTTSTTASSTTSTSTTLLSTNISTTTTTTTSTTLSSTTSTSTTSSSTSSTVHIETTDDVHLTTTGNTETIHSTYVNHTNTKRPFTTSDARDSAEVKPPDTTHIETSEASFKDRMRKPKFPPLITGYWWLDIGIAIVFVVFIALCCRCMCAIGKKYKLKRGESESSVVSHDVAPQCLITTDVIDDLLANELRDNAFPCSVQSDNTMKQILREGNVSQIIYTPQIPDLKQQITAEELQAMREEHRKKKSTLYDEEHDPDHDIRYVLSNNEYNQVDQVDADEIDDDDSESDSEELYIVQDAANIQRYQTPTFDAQKTHHTSADSTTTVQSGRPTKAIRSATLSL